MPRWFMVPVDRPELPPYPISDRLRGQLVYFITPPGTEGIPELGEDEHWIAPADVERWLDDGVLYLVSPLDTANMTECELSEEQESFLNWLKANKASHLRIKAG